MVNTIFLDNRYLLPADKDPLPARSGPPTHDDYNKLRGRFPNLQCLRFSFDDVADWRSRLGLPFNYIKYTLEGTST